MLKDYYVYILECSNGRLYTGYTVDIKKRFSEHVSGKKGAKFTRAFKPKKIAAVWKVTGERGDAMHIEAFIKSLTRNEKIFITGNPETLIERLSLIENSDYAITVLD